MRSVIKLQLIVLSALLVSPILLAQPTPRFKAEQLQFGAASNYFASEANYDDEGGSFEKLRDGYSYQYLGIDLKASYATSKRLNLFSSLNIGYSKSSDTKASRDNSRINELSLGTHYRFRHPWFRLVPELSVTLPIYTYDNTTDESLLGEGVMATQLGLWLQKKIFGLYTHLYGGYRQRQEGRSDLLLWKIGTRKRFSGFSVGLGAEGYESITDDKDTDNPVPRTTVTDRVNAGSLKFYSVNPSLLEAVLWSDIYLSRDFDIHLSYAQTINGTSQAAGYTVAAGFTWRALFIGEPRKKSGLINRKERKQLEQFDIEAKPVDESLFKEEPVQRKRRRRTAPRED